MAAEAGAAGGGAGDALGAAQGGADAADAAAVAACLAGERQAFAGIVARHQDRIYGLALRWTGSAEDAGDLTQETFLRAFVGLHRFDARRAFLPWLLRIAVNLCRDWHRRQRGRTPADDPALWETLAAPGATPAEAAEAAEVRRAVRRAVSALPPAYRLVVVLAYDQGLSLKDVAAATGLPLTVVKNRLFRARRMLAGRLAALGPAPFAAATRAGAEGAGSSAPGASGSPG